MLFASLYILIFIFHFRFVSWITDVMWCGWMNWCVGRVKKVSATRTGLHNQERHFFLFNDIVLYADPLVGCGMEVNRNRSREWERERENKFLSKERRNFEWKGILIYVNIEWRRWMTFQILVFHQNLGSKSIRSKRMEI